MGLCLPPPRRHPRRHRHPGRPQAHPDRHPARPHRRTIRRRPRRGASEECGETEFAKLQARDDGSATPAGHPGRARTRSRLEWLPAGGTPPLGCGDARSRNIPADFYRALLRIWLGDKPVDADPEKPCSAKAEHLPRAVPQAQNSSMAPCFNPTATDRPAFAIPAFSAVMSAPFGAIGVPATIR